MHGFFCQLRKCCCYHSSMHGIVTFLCQRLSCPAHCKLKDSISKTQNPAFLSRAFYFLLLKLSAKQAFVQATPFWNLRLRDRHYPGGMAPLAVPMVMRWVPGRLRLFCPLMVRAWWPWEDEREGIAGEQGKLELDRGDCTWSALACPPPMLMLLLLAPGDTDVADQRDVPAKVLLCLTIVRVPAVPAFPAAPL